MYKRQAFEKVLTDGYKPNMVQSDKGTEFLNSTFQSMLKQHNIKFYTSENEDMKAAVVERFNRTLKTKMYRYFTARNTRRYVDVLPDLLHSYNHTYHRSIGMAPIEVDDTNEHLVRARLYPLKPKSYKWKYDVGESTTSAVQKGISRSMVRRDFCDRRASVHHTSHLQTKRSGTVCTTYDGLATTPLCMTPT